MSPSTSLYKRIHELDPWFQNFEFDGIRTAPDHFLGDYPSVNWRRFADAVPHDLSGMSVLDIGCNAGFYALEMKRRGADKVVGIDSDPRYLQQARLAAECLNLEIELQQLSVYELKKLGMRFDLVIFMGVLYHLRHPLLALDLIYDYVADDLLLFQSMQRGPSESPTLAEDYPIERTDPFEEPGYPSLYFVEHKYCGDPTNWWIPNRTAAEAMLRSAGFQVVAHPEREVYLCRRTTRPEWKDYSPIAG